ncbi:MAG: glycerol-3-phosphate 1-O-acyltransferase PlsY [Candidatus Omnitrophica bacterium]|nr:glycerol-3-phosphate 1-O-acyltransferase PlsY [Candidatus Omnitrophota bacterium]
MTGILLGAAISYLIGAIPTAFIVAKLVKGIDIRAVGSGNVGATNTLRNVGKIPGFIVLLIDVAKGFAAVRLVGGVFAGRPPIEPAALTAVCGFAVVCGHIFNIFLRGRGGKGVATGLGVILGVSPAAAAGGMIVFIATLGVSKYVSASSIAACLAIPFFLLAMRAPEQYLLLGAALAVLITAKHRANIQRLLSGREHSVFKKR